MNNWSVVDVMMASPTYDSGSILAAVLANLHIKSQNVDAKAIVAYMVLALVILASWDYASRPLYPSVNYKQGEVSKLPATLRFLRDGAGLVTRGIEKVIKRLLILKLKLEFKGPVSIVTLNGPQIILPPEKLDALLREEHKLDFHSLGRREFFSDFPGFEAFGPHPKGMVEEIVRVRISRSLQWHDVDMKPEVLQMISRLSARSFVGKDLSRNQQWLDVTVAYTVNVFIAATILHLFPRFLVPVVHWFLPHCITARRHMREARALLAPVVDARREERRVAISKGLPVPEHLDTLDWFDIAAKGRPYDSGNLQMGLAMASIHTTADLFAQALYNLAIYPEYQQSLRGEASRVLSPKGWVKSALHDLVLLDSFLKETQRHKPILTATMNRFALEDVTLPDGTFLPKGSVTKVSSHRMWSSDIHECPEEFQGDRFVKMRNGPNHFRAHMVATSADHLIFSHGKHACPGRFFAANEVKIAMLHILFKYDLKIASCGPPKVFKVGMSQMSDRKGTLAIRRRHDAAGEALLRGALVVDVGDNVGATAGTNVSDSATGAIETS